MPTNKVRYALSVDDAQGLPVRAAAYHTPINLGLPMVFDAEDGSVLVVGGAR